MFADADNPALQALERYAAERRAFWANPPRGACGEPGCTEQDAVLYTAVDGVPRCAHHHSLLADRSQSGGYPCDNCGDGPAFRDPEHRRDEYLCPRCHVRHDNYEPGQRAMVFKTRARIGMTNKSGRTEPCIARGRGTDCAGQVKPRGKLGVLCDFHVDPVKYTKARQV